MSRYYLGIDNGGTMTKAALFSQNGKEVAVATRNVKIFLEPNDGNERDANLMWEKTIDAIREVVINSGVSAKDIKGVACTGHGNGLYLVDENGEPVRRAINSTDGRAHKYVAEWIEQGINEKALPKTTQCLWPAQPNALLLWLRDNEPETLDKVRWILMAKDYIRLKLTGEVFAEITDMSGTSLMNVVSGKYDKSVLELFEIAEFQDMLPSLIGSADKAGKITKEIAKLTGLKEGTLVAGGMFDIDACSLASGIVDEGQMSMVVGTWGNNQYIAREPLVDKDLFMTSIYCIPGWYLMLEGSPTSAGNLEWFIRNFLQAEKDKLGKDFYEWLNNEVESIDPGTTDLIFLPFLYGCNEKEPVSSGFQYIKGEYTRSHMIRAVYEGIVFSHKHHIERLLNFRDKPKVIRCTGGAAQSTVWMQMFADAVGIPVEVPAGTQLGALGAAMAAAVCAGEYERLEDAVKSMTSVARRFEPDPVKKEIYRSKYLKYRELIGLLTK